MVEKVDSVKSASAFNFSYSDAGLFGVKAVSNGDGAIVVSALKNLVTEVASKPDEADVEAAKNRLINDYNNLPRVARINRFANVFLANGSLETPSSFASQIRAVTAKDVQKVASV